MKISVWDDNASAATQWKERLDSVLTDKGTRVHAATSEEIENDIHVLHERRRAYLKCDQAIDSGAKCGLDDTGILIADNDLFALPRLNDLSAETVASRVSVYTDCACIVVLNLNPDLDFDLTLLGHPESKADLHINDRFIGDAGLWQQCPKEGGIFRPWHWPFLLSTADSYRSRAAELGRLLKSTDRDRPILDFLGIAEISERRLSRMARAFLHPTKRAEETSFMDFVNGNTRAVNERDGERMAACKDVTKIARVGARRISKWLAQYVAGPQDVLIDFPHLVEKMPFLVPSDQQECPEAWNSCAKLADAPVEWVEDSGIKRFESQDWFDRPAFFTTGMESESNMRRLLQARGTNPLGLVFCEDASAFHGAEVCEQFVAAYGSMSDRRFVRWRADGGGDVRYGPLSRLAM